MSDNHRFYAIGNFIRLFLFFALFQVDGFGQQELDQFGGWTAHKLEASGRFRIATWEGKQWVITPEGHPLIVVGLAHTRFPSPPERPTDDLIEEKFGKNSKAYGKDVVRWMSNAGFNTISGYPPNGADNAMNEIGSLGLIPSFISAGPAFPDLYDPKWRKETVKKIKKRLPKLKNDPRVIGYVLSQPLFITPKMVPNRMFERLGVKKTNIMMKIRAMPGNAVGKKVYIEFLKRRYKTLENYTTARGAVQGASEINDLLDIDLSVDDDPSILHPDDAVFYKEMWNEVTGFIVSEVRKIDPDGIILSYRLIGFDQWSESWLRPFLEGVGPHIDAFAPEIYGDEDYRSIVQFIGEVGGKPVLIGDGMRPREFNYPEEVTIEDEVTLYTEMFTSLLRSPWYLGGCICEYRDRKGRFSDYTLRPGVPRRGIRNPDFSEREPLLDCYRKFHGEMYSLKKGN